MDAPSRETLRSSPAHRFRKGRNATKADIFLWEHGGARLAIKDYSPRPAWVRRTLGPLLVRREVSAYRRLEGLEGVPRFAGRIDSLAFAVEFIEGRDLSHFRRGEVPASFFRHLIRVLEAVHATGVAQSDLHHRDILVGPGRKPFIVDFSTAMFIDKRSGPLRRRLFRAACGSDRRAVLKLMHRHAPDALDAAERHELSHPPAWYRLGKGLGRLTRARRRRLPQR